MGEFLADAVVTETSPVQFAGTTLPSEAIDRFVTLAADEGVTVPDGVTDRELLHELLLTVTAWGRWGPAGAYTVAALHDSDVTFAAAQLDRLGDVFRSQ